MIIAVVISFLMIIISFFFKRSRFVALMLFFFMWLLFGWNYMNGDYLGYENMFAYNEFEISLKGYEAGFKSLMMFFLLKGYNFQSFFIAISAVILLLLYFFIIKTSKYPAFISSVFFVFYFPLDYVILRNFLAFVLILQGFVLVFKNKKYSKFFFALIVALACTMHISSVFYFFFLFAFQEFKIDYKKIVLLVIFGLIIYIPLKVHIFNYFLADVSEKNEVYSNSFHLFIFLSIVQIINFLFMKYVIKLDTSHFQIKQNISSIYIYNINLILVLLIVFYFDMAIFVRVFRNMSLLNIIYTTNLILSVKDCKAKKIVLFLLLYLVFFYLFFIVPVFDNTLHSLYKYNVIFN